MKHLLYLLTALIALFISACSITSSVHFAKDFSGKYSMNIDMREALNFMMEMDSTFQDSLDNWTEMADTPDFSEIGEALNETEGISNYNLDASEVGIIALGFDFTDVEALNRGIETLNRKFQESQDEEEDEEMMGMPTATMMDEKQEFKVNGKQVTYTATNSLGGADDSEMMEGMEDAMGFFDVFIEMSFDRKIKSADFHGVTLVKQDDHVIRTRMDFIELAENSKPLTIDVKVK